MRKFRFKLQAVLDHRKFEEDRLKVELANLMGEEARERSKLAQLIQELELSQQILIDKLQSAAEASELKLIDEYAKAKLDDIRVQQLTIDAIVQRVEAKRLEVLQAMKRRKLLEALRDKQKSLHLYEAARLEQGQLDDDASVKFARRMANGDDRVQSEIQTG